MKKNCPECGAPIVAGGGHNCAKHWCTDGCSRDDKEPEE